MNNQKLIIGIFLPLITVCFFVFLSYNSWIVSNSEIQLNTSFCTQNPEYVNIHGIEQCNRFTENNIAQFNNIKIFSVGKTAFVLFLGIVLSFLSFRQSENIPFDKKTKWLLLIVLGNFILLLLASALVGGRNPVLSFPLGLPLFLGALIGVAITWGYTVYYFVKSIIEKNYYKIILSILIGALVSSPVLYLASSLFVK